MKSAQVLQGMTPCRDGWSYITIGNVLPLPMQPGASSQGLPKKRTGAARPHLLPAASPADLNLSLRPFPLSLGGGMKAGTSGPYTSTRPDSCVQDQDRPSRAHRSPRPPVSSVNGSQTNHPSGPLCIHPGGRWGPCSQENLH